MMHWRFKGKNRDTITLAENDRVINIFKEGDTVEFMEACDDHYGEQMSKDEAIEALEEAIAWLREDK